MPRKLVTLGPVHVAQIAALFPSLVDVEDDVQELSHELHVVREPLLEVHHHPRQQQGLLSQRGAGLVLGEGNGGSYMYVSYRSLFQLFYFHMSRGEGKGY